jgi:hypothetical protein
MLRHLYSIVEILASVYNTGHHLVTINDNEADIRDPQAALVRAAAHFLSAAAPLALFSTIRDSASPHRHAILALHHDISPSSTAYDALADLPLARSHASAS